MWGWSPRGEQNEADQLIELIPAEQVPVPNVLLGASPPWSQLRPTGPRDEGAITSTLQMKKQAPGGGGAVCPKSQTEL